MSARVESKQFVQRVNRKKVTVWRHRALCREPQCIPDGFTLWFTSWYADENYALSRCLDHNRVNHFPLENTG